MNFNSLLKMIEIIVALIEEKPIKEVEENGIVTVELDKTKVIIKKDKS